MRLNLLLISVDQMRGDCLGILEHPVVETPNLDQLARLGVLFDNAYSATPVCIPARAALLTGMTQRTHGRIGYQDEIPWNYEHTLPGELASSGYHTQCVGKMHVYPTRNLCGFHNVVLHDGYLHHNRSKVNTRVDQSWDSCDDYLPWLRQQGGAHRDMLDLGLDCNSSTVARPWHLDEALHPTNWVVTQSIDFLRRRDPSKPFFLKMSFVRPHPPFDPPQTYYDQYLQADFPEPFVGEWADTEDLERNGRGPTPYSGVVSKKMLRRARAAYYALITHIDHQIGRFMNAMFEYGVHDNTIILFTSDHGEMLGDHNLFRKGVPYEGSANVPFILNDPTGSLQLKAGTVVSEPIELRDIMPTLLEAAGTPIPTTVEGKSVLPLARGEQISWRSYIHGEMVQGVRSNQYLTNGQEKYIWFSQTGVEQYFDLRKDPHELKCEADNPQYTERISFWRQNLMKELEGREEGFVQNNKLIVGRKTVNALQHILNREDPLE